MGSSQSTHYCWPGCGCAQRFQELEYGIPFTPAQPLTFEPIFGPMYDDGQFRPVNPELPFPNGMLHLVCPCNTVWCSILPRPPCPWHSVTPYPYLPQVTVDLKFDIKALEDLQAMNDRPWWEAYGKHIGPELMYEFLRAMLYPLLET